jgi:hypothetical protein
LRIGESFVTEELSLQSCGPHPLISLGVPIFSLTSSLVVYMGRAYAPTDIFHHDIFHFVDLLLNMSNLISFFVGCEEILIKTSEHATRNKGGMRLPFHSQGMTWKPENNSELKIISSEIYCLPCPFPSTPCLSAPKRRSKFCAENSHVPHIKMQFVVQ